MSLQDMLKKAKEADDKDQSKGKLFLSILGESGAGKSHSIGTLGVKTLLLTFLPERHGVTAAKKEGNNNIVELFLDIDDETGDDLTPDQTLGKLREILNSDLYGNGFEALVIDGLTELDICISGSNELKKQCLTSAGKVDGFRLGPVTKMIMRGVIKQLITLQKTQGVHIITTCIVDVKERGDNGEVIECNPRLNTYSLAEDTLQQFGDRVVTYKVIKKDKSTLGIFDFMSDISKTSKDANGVTKKVFNASPRLSTGQIPDKVIKADLKKLLELKAV